jgi:hypothetical protein
MHPIQPFQRVSGLLAVVGGPLAWASLLLGLSAVGFDGELLSDPARVLAFSPVAAGLIRWSFVLSIFGAYLLLMPLAIWLGAAPERQADAGWRWLTLCGLGYLALGALGAAILAAAWAWLSASYAQTPLDQRPALLLAFSAATTIAEDGLQGVVQNLAGAIWWLGIGASVRRQRPGLGAFTIALGGLSLINVVGNLTGSAALSLIGLSATALLAPLWSIWVGLLTARGGLGRR